MEHDAANYLYTVAVVAVTFVGFSTVFITFREALGGQMSKYDVLLIHNILYLGITVIVGSLLPPLLWLLGASTGVIVRVSSLVTAVPTLVFSVTYPRSRRKATGRPMPKRVWVDLGVVYAGSGVLLANAAAMIGPSFAAHSGGVTLLLVATFVAFLFGLDLLPQEPARPVEGAKEGEAETGRTTSRRRASKR